MKTKYLLSTGVITDQIEYYIIDLFKVYLAVYPGDIPNASHIGFDFIITDTKKADLLSDIKSKINSLLSKIQNKVSKEISISVAEAVLIDETTVKLVINVNQVKSDEILVDLYKNN